MMEKFTRSTQKLGLLKVIFFVPPKKPLVILSLLCLGLFLANPRKADKFKDVQSAPCRSDSFA